MNKEELKQLKPGDEILIRARYEKTLNDGDVRFSCPVKTLRDKTMQVVGFSLPSHVILPPPAPKYDPCRLFKTGDIVTPIERDGREVPDGAPVGEKCTVVESEKNGIVCIQYDAGSEHYLHEIPYFHLELVTPEEELEPYKVKKYGAFYAVEKRDNHKDRPATYDVDFHPHAKEAAEAERDRLNAAYRKEKK